MFFFLLLHFSLFLLVFWVKGNIRRKWTRSYGAKRRWRQLCVQSWEKLRKLEVIYYTVAMKTKMKMNNEIKSLCKADKNGEREIFIHFSLPTFRGFYCNFWDSQKRIAKLKGWRENFIFQIFHDSTSLSRGKNHFFYFAYDD